MAKLTITNETDSAVTVISNIFIDTYMKDANDAQLKVYLYIFRMIQSHTDFSISDIADQFNHTEREVLRALKYWEKQKLMSLTFDGAKNLTGIRLLDPATQTSVQPAVEPATHSMSSASMVQPVVTDTSEPAPQPIMQQTAAEPHTFQQPDTSAALPPAEDISRFAKPSYSPDQLRAFKDKEGTEQLLFIAQAYVGKPLSPSDMKTILYMSDVLEFSDDLIDYLIQYCVEKGKKDFRYMEKVALNWAESGIKTPQDAEQVALKYDRSVYSIMKELGKTSAPTSKELEYINRWIKEYGFTNDVIFEACSRTVLATDKHRFEYADGILQNWSKEGVHHKSDIQKLDQSYAQKRSQTSRPVTNNKFNQFAQNNYDFNALEEALLNH